MARPRKTAAAAGEDKPDRQFVTALSRGLEILRCFNATRTELGTMEIAHLTGLPQPTVWRLCHTLEVSGYLAPSPSSDKMRIGPAVLGLGYAALATLDLGDIALHGMQRLADQFRAASSLAAPDRHDMLIVRRATAADSLLIVNLHVGSRLPMATSSFGWAYIAGLQGAARAAVLKDLAKHYGREWPAHLRQIESAIEMYEKRGYVVNAGTYHKDINAVAVPIVPENGGTVLAMNLGGPAAVVPLKRLEKEVAPRLIELAEMVRAGMAIRGGERAGRALAGI